MIWNADGIRVTAPVKWRVLDGLVSVYWEAESPSGASGYFLSHDPRIMIFFRMCRRRYVYQTKADRSICTSVL